MRPLSIDSVAGAYLVDLLQFLGSDDTAWAAFTAAWKGAEGGHEGAPYPFSNQAAFTAAGSPAGTEISPFAVLMSRRPDIQNLQLVVVPSLYRQMFLNPTLLKQDAVFADNGYGAFLEDGTTKLADHVEALRSAFNLTADEYDRIIADLGYNTGTILSLSAISAIFRRGWLARKLKISVRELLLLIQLTGLDPFTVPDPVAPGLMRLIWLIQAMRDRSLKFAVALYLIWNHDLSGKSAPAVAH